jgi:PhnB protein
VRLDIYVNYPGHCEEAFRFYEDHLGGRLTEISLHQRVPNKALPENWAAKVLHARLELGSTILMGADVPGAEPMRSAYLTLRLETAEEAERVYALLADGGQVFMPMEETFFSLRFAMLRDRFGTSWMLLCERPTTGGEVPS